MPYLGGALEVQQVMMGARRQRVWCNACYKTCLPTHELLCRVHMHCQGGADAACGFALQSFQLGWKRQALPPWRLRIAQTLQELPDLALAGRLLDGERSGIRQRLRRRLLRSHGPNEAWSLVSLCTWSGGHPQILDIFNKKLV